MARVQREPVPGETKLGQGLEDGVEVLGRRRQIDAPGFASMIRWARRFLPNAGRRKKSRSSSTAASTPSADPSDSVSAAFNSALALTGFISADADQARDW